LNKTITYQDLKNRLTAFGLKATQQRIVIYEALALAKDHPTAEVIYEKIRPLNPSISLGTVYKTLDTFVTVHLADKVLSDHGSYRYDANTGFHNHIYCTNTREILDYEDEALNVLVEEFFKNKNIVNLKIKDIRLQINGEKINPEEDIYIQ
jgi:Fur family peroxide stress response transcriptional regulator